MSNDIRIIYDSAEKALENYSDLEEMYRSEQNTNSNQSSTIRTLNDLNNELEIEIESLEERNLALEDKMTETEV